MQPGPAMIVQTRLVFAAPGPCRIDQLAEEFPSVKLSLVLEPHRPRADHVCVTLDGARWQSGDWTACDASMRVFEDRKGELELLTSAAQASELALQVLTRYQRFVSRRNAHSTTSQFDRVLERHRDLFRLDKPLVRADYDHAIDTWQWLLRLAPDASLAAQLAALLHDIERLASEAEVRLEHLAADYGAFKRKHALAGAAIARDLLADLAFPEPVIERAAALVAGHDAPGAHDPELALLEDADALSFFSLNSPGFVDYYGAEHAQKKIAWSLARMSPAARARLTRIRLRQDVARMVERALVRAES